MDVNCRKNKKFNYENVSSENYFYFRNDNNKEINSDKISYKNSHIDDITCIVVFLEVHGNK